MGHRPWADFSVVGEREWYGHTALLFNGSTGAILGLVVTVPPPLGGSGPSAPTGIVFNGTGDFPATGTTPGHFLFATEDGTISAWASGAVAALKVDNSSSRAVYKGLALGVLNGKNLLYAANFRSGHVDVFDGSFAPVNVQNVGGFLFVTYAKQDAAKDDDVAGPGLGYVNEFGTDGKLVMRLKHGPWLNSPWGVTLAPAGFGELSGRLLIGNFGSGQIASFDMRAGEFNGLMRGRRGKPITIDGLWGLGFGNGGAAGPVTTLFFAAGIQDEAHGLFGTLAPIKINDDQGEGENDNRQVK